MMHEAIVQSALISAQRAEELGLPPSDIILSAKVSAVQDLVSVYTMLAARSDYALHVGLTEAGMGSKGIVASTAGIGLLLQAGIGDTIRVSLTPEPGGDRTLEVKVAQEILQSMGLRSFMPVVTACPGCGRTTSPFPGARQQGAGHDQRAHARMAQALPRRRDAELRGNGLHRERPRQIKAGRHRHFASRHRRIPGRPGVHGWKEDDNSARPEHCR